MTAAGLVCGSCGTEISAKAKFRNDRNIDICPTTSVTRFCRPARRHPPPAAAKYLVVE
jgi:hypothetical protein